MSTKRPHRKSRFGCDQCRKRRVKCDEQQPRCAACTHRDEPCRFSRFPRAWRQDGTPSHSDSPPTEPQAETVCIPTSDASICAEPPTSHDMDISMLSCPGSSSSRFQELELMHYWCTRTSSSFSQENTMVFRDYVVQQALRFGFLMEALLAVTSVHLACEAKDANLAHAHVSAALQYQTKAMAGLRSTLSTLSPLNCDAVFVSSMLVMVCSIVSPLISTARIDSIKSTAEAILTLVDLVKGIRSIHHVGRAWLIEGPLRWFCGGVFDLPPISFSSPLGVLRDLNSAMSCDPVQHIFNHAIDELEQAHQSKKSVVPWLLAMKPAFLEELKKDNSVAVAIFMHWGVMLDQLDDMWWAKYAGRRLVEEMSTTLDSRGEEWRQLTAWCRTQVGLCQE
ncbi:hypothetical protein K458DRAFT_316923 [Lentithecium fluviatile CBS 122367]|uniref:Zn(2)-C6 fungal-type domain-containing protein n=1 Tax=Lentithecium fluviatile CBS 122367 TaxID=1168545 RepID=A0A6G1IJV1_9PLEO|nr:hypothetical protein K458DRAFT_316923 [Lentithecium fluviatile CBS 122367]